MRSKVDDVLIETEENEKAAMLFVVLSISFLLLAIGGIIVMAVVL